MRLKKKEKSVGVLGKILNLFSNSKEDTYSCDYINKKLDDTGWISVEELEGDYSMYFRYRRKNGVVTVSCRSKIPTIAGDYITIFTLPEGFRPAFPVPFTFHCVGGDCKTQSAFVEPGGNISCYSAYNSQYPAFTISFPVD